MKHFKYIYICIYGTKKISEETISLMAKHFVVFVRREGILGSPPCSPTQNPIPIEGIAVPSHVLDNNLSCGWAPLISTASFARQIGKAKEGRSRRGKIEVVFTPQRDTARKSFPRPIRPQIITFPDHHTYYTHHLQRPPDRVGLQLVKVLPADHSVNGLRRLMGGLLNEVPFLPRRAGDLNDGITYVHPPLISHRIFRQQHHRQPCQEGSARSWRVLWRPMYSSRKVKQPSGNRSASP